MIKAREDGSFAQELLLRFFDKHAIQRTVIFDLFQCALSPFKEGVIGKIDAAHAAASDDFFNEIAILQNLAWFSRYCHLFSEENYTLRFECIIIYREMEKKNTSLLIAQNGKLNGKQWLLDDEIVIGRDAECELVIDDRQVSRKHARILQTPEGIFVEDLNSKNGTYINHRKVEGTAQVFDGDFIQIALIQEFLFVASDATMPLSEEQAYRIVFIDKGNGAIWVNDKKIDPPLSIQQYTLLLCLYEQSGNIVPRSEIIARVWADSAGAGISNEAIDALVRRLRYRLAEYEPDVELIETVRGYGFRFQNPIKR